MKTYSIKNLVLAFLLFVPVLFLSSCGDVLRGEGETVSRTRTVAAFDAVDVQGKFDVFLTQGPAQDILIEGQENIVSQITTRVSNGKLLIEFDRKRVKINTPVRIYLTTPNLTEVLLSGSNTVKGLTDWNVNNFKVRASGSGNIFFTLRNAQHVESRISGSGKVTLTGNAESYDGEISGSGDIKAYDLQTKTADVSVSGSGRCELTVTENLKARISGSGKVRYRGTPAIDSHISGSGSVSKAE